MPRRIVPLALATALSVGLLGILANVAFAAVTPDQQAALLAAQNTVRRNTAASETQRLGQTVTIPDLSWNPAAASVAQAWADHLLATNTFEHNANRGNFGENIYMESGSDPTTSAPRAVAAWASEAASYTWDTNSCSTVCGHYTQIVWAATTSVGCGVSTNGTDTYWVCDYAPPGNFIGQRPYEPGGPAATTAPGGATTPAGTTNPATPPAPNNPAPSGATTPAGATAGPTWTGTWSVDDFGFGAGGTLILVQNGSQVSGSYAYADPSGCGTENGALNGTASGTSLTFTSSETGCAGTGGASGTLILAADGGSFAGGGAWDGTRTGP